MSLSEWNEDKIWACEQAVLPADDKETHFSTQKKTIWLEHHFYFFVELYSFIISWWCIYFAFKFAIPISCEVSHLQVYVPTDRYWDFRWLIYTLCKCSVYIPGLCTIQNQRLVDFHFSCWICIEYELGSNLLCSINYELQFWIYI